MIHVRHLIAIEDESGDLGDECQALPIGEILPLEGETIAGVLDRAGWNLELLPTVVRMGDLYYARDEWAVTPIDAEQPVLVISRPANGAAGGSGGGQGKAIMAAVAMVALAILAPYAAAAIGLTGLAASVAAAVIVGAGGLLISHFLKPKKAKPAAKDSPLYSFGLSGNQAKPLQMIPIGYGRRLTTPDLAAPTYSEYSGDDMITYGLYAIGCGRYTVEELRLGDTTIWTEADGPQGVGADIEIALYEPGEQVDLFPVNVITSSDVSGQAMEHAVSGDLNWVGPFAVNPANTSCGEILFDFVWPQGAGATYKDRSYSVGTGILAQARLINDAGAPIGSWVTLINHGYQFLKTSQFRVTERRGVTPGRYEVRVGVSSEPLGQSNDGKINAHNDVVWSAMRAHIDGPQSFPGVMTLAVKATANAGLQTVNNGKLGVIATRILPVWNGSTWVEEESRSIAWAAADAWSNVQYSAGLPLSRIDLDAFVAYDEFWADADHTFDHWFTDSMSVVEAIETILKAGRAVPDIVGDTITIFRDEETAIPAMIFTDNEIVRGSVSIDYTLFNSAIADGVIGQYLDETTWRLAEVNSAPDGVVLAKPAKVELTGITKRPQAAGLVRFSAAENQYRRISAEFQIEAEGYLVKRGMPIAIQTEQPQQWGFSGQVLDYNPSTRAILLDTAPPWDSGASTHWIELRAADGSYWGPARITKGTIDTVAIVNLADTVSIGDLTEIDIADALARTPDQELPSYVFAAGQPQAFRAIIREGQPGGDLITITAIKDDPRVYDVVETGVAPLPSVPPIFNLEVPGSILQLTARMQQEGPNGVVIAGWSPASRAVRYLGEISYDEGATWSTVHTAETTSCRAIVTPVDLQFRVRGINAAGDVGQATVIAVTGVPIVISGDTVNMVVDIDTLHPDLFDTAVTKAITDQAASEVQDFISGVFDIQQTDDLVRSINRQESTANNAAAAVQTETITRANETGALAAQILTLTAQYQSDIAAAVLAESIARAGQDDAIAAQLVTLTADYTSAISAAISTESGARASGDSALAGQITTLTAAFNDANSLDASVIWNFEGSLESWTASGATLNTQPQFMRMVSTGTDPALLSPAISLDGSKNYIVQIRIIRNAGTGWDGSLFYSTAGHTFDGAFYKALPNPNLAVGQGVILTFDMRTLTAGGADWTGNTITGLRFDLGSTSADIFRIDWIAIGKQAPPNYQAAVQLEATARADAVSAQATLVTALTATVTGHTSSITTLQSVSTALGARYTLELDVDGAIAGFSAYAGGGLSAFVIRADSFAIKNGAGTVTPFFIESGAVYINTAVIKDLSVTNIKVANRAISSAYYAEGTTGNATAVVPARAGSVFIITITAENYAQDNLDLGIYDVTPVTGLGLLKTIPLPPRLQAVNDDGDAGSYRVPFSYTYIHIPTLMGDRHMKANLQLTGVGPSTSGKVLISVLEVSK